AMDVVTCSAALDIGALVAADLVAGPPGARALVPGEMGIGNTTPAAALVAAFTGRPAAEVTGRGTGVDDAGLARKTAVVEAALARHAGAVAAGPRETLAALGASAPWVRVACAPPAGSAYRAALLPSASSLRHFTIFWEYV